MSNDNVPASAQVVQGQSPYKSCKPLLQLGQVVATPAVLDHLEKHAVLPAALLSRQQHGDWGNVDAEDAKTNDEAVRTGARVIGSHTVAGAVIWVITNSVDDSGNRASTCLLFPEEY